MFTDGRTDKQTDDRQTVITEHSSDELKNKNVIVLVSSAAEQASVSPGRKTLKIGFLMTRLI